MQTPPRAPELAPNKLLWSSPELAMAAWLRKFRVRHGRNPLLPEVCRNWPELSRSTCWRKMKLAQRLA